MRQRTVEGVAFDLLDLQTGSVVGQMTPAGDVLSDDPRVSEQVARAFARELMIRDGELVEELGVCFADVEILAPGQPGHGETVIRHLDALTGYLPRPRETDNRPV